MLFSVIVPTCQRPVHLRNCVRSLLNQDIPSTSYEIIVVNDNPKDNTEALIEKLRKEHTHIRYFKTDCKSAGGARNVGLRHAKGRFIAFTDDDCIVERDWLLKIKSAFEHSKADAIGGSIVNPTDSYIAWSQYLLNFSVWMPFGKRREMHDIPTANICYRKKSIENRFFVEFTPDCVYEDSLFNHQLVREGKKIIFSPEIKVFHHTWDKQRTLKRYFFMQKKMARGFVAGGYAVHGKIGELLLKYPFLNLCCPRLLIVGKRCIKAKKGLLFFVCVPLLFVGEMYKGLQIIMQSNKLKKDIKNCISHLHRNRA